MHYDNRTHDVMHDTRRLLCAYVFVKSKQVAIKGLPHMKCERLWVFGWLVYWAPTKSQSQATQDHQYPLD